MAGKHHKRSRLGSSVARVGAPGGIAAAAVGAISLSTVLMTGTTTAVAPSLALVALITPANSTSQIFAGTEYYGTDYANSNYVPPQVLVPFFLGPQGIADAVRNNDDDPKGTVIISSGWGAGQTGTALGQLDGDELDNVDRVIFDNNTNRAGGGFWTTYYPFAPLLFTSAEPTPDGLDVDEVWDVGYEYNVNGNAVTYPINVIADANSLVAYFYGYGAQGNAEFPNVPGGLQPGKHYIVAPDGTYRTVDLDDSVTTTFVTFESDGLPLLRPLKLLPGGDIVAATLEPAVTEIVKAGYKDNEPIPEDPTVERPMGLLPTTETATMLNRLPGAIHQGLEDGAETAQEDFANPGNFVTKPLSEAAKLPLISSLTNSTVSTNNLNLTTYSRLSSDAKNTGTTPSAGSERPRPLKKIAENVRSSLDRLAGGADDEPSENNNEE